MNEKIANPISILLVDDNADIQTVIPLSLQPLGYRVATAGDATSALAMLDTIQPDIAIIDYGLPDGDGVELGARIRQHPLGHDIHLILFSGKHDPELARQATAAGFSAYLVKPIRLNELLEKIRNLALCGN